MTFESSLPYVSIAAGLGAGAAAGGARQRLTATLAGLAVAALALFAYFRWIAPTEAPLGLVLGAAGLVLLPPTAARWRSPAIGLLVAEWLVFAYLFLKTGDGLSAMLMDAARAGLTAAVVFGTAFLLRRLWTRLERPRSGAAAELAALALMMAAALTLDWSFWPAMAGGAAVLAAEAALLVSAARRAEPSPLVPRLAWMLSFLGQAAIAYAFLR